MHLPPKGSQPLVSKQGYSRISQATFQETCRIPSLSNHQSSAFVHPFCCPGMSTPLTRLNGRPPPRQRVHQTCINQFFSPRCAIALQNASPILPCLVSPLLASPLPSCPLPPLPSLPLPKTTACKATTTASRKRKVGESLHNESDQPKRSSTHSAISFRPKRQMHQLHHPLCWTPTLSFCASTHPERQ